MSTTYWNNDGKYNEAVKALQAMIPAEGAVKGSKNKALERLRKAINKYYRLYNDGDFNIGARTIFGIEEMWEYTYYKTYTDWKGRLQSRKAFNEKLYAAVEEAMDEIVIAAALEQGVAL